jgi:hypothetical protein
MSEMDSNQQPQGKPTHDQMRRRFAEGKSKMIRKILALGYNMGYDKPETTTENFKMKKWEVNKAHVNRWLLSEKSSVRKALDDMTYSELVKALTQFEQVYKDYLKRI